MNLKKIALSIFLLTAFVTTSAKQVILASTIPPVSPSSFSIGITPYAEETIWKYRNNNGKWQKRLWSVTYRKWLTDWIDVP